MANISEGRNATWLDNVASTTPGVVDVHRDPDHNRSVFTMLGTSEALIESVMALARAVVSDLDLSMHDGVHPRIGVLDVVPFVPLGSATIDQAAALRDDCARRLSSELNLPCFLYGPLGQENRTLPSIRSDAFDGLAPDFGPPNPHRSAGAVAVGARLPLVAWNIWLSGVALSTAKEIARSVRSANVRSLGLQVGDAVQVSCNLLEPSRATPQMVLDLVLDRLADRNAFDRCELVGLAPMAVLDAIPELDWERLDLSPSTTIEHAAAALGLSLG